MKIGGVYSFNGGAEIVAANYAAALAEVNDVIAGVDVQLFKTKASLEKTMRGRMLYQPVSLNLAFRERFTTYGWRTHRVTAIIPPPSTRRGTRRSERFAAHFGRWTS